MTQQITLLGASYSDVPAVTLPKTGGGTASFTDVTDTTAGANDVAAGKYFYTAAGVKTEGTSTGGNPTLITKSITANGTYNASSDSADGYSSVTVNVSGGGGGGDMSDPIRFFDYDGTLVASYSSVPASLPSVPTHTGLTNGTWNYTLQEVTTQFNAMGTCDVGANYETVSGATEIDIELQDGRLHPYLSLAVKGTVEIDWGDNSTPDTSTGTSLTTRITDIHHEYAEAGSYTIKISKTSGTGYALYCTTAYTLLHNNNSTSSANRVYSNCVQSVRVGADCTVGNSAFYACYSLESVSMPSDVTSISSSTFQYCYSLTYVSIPSGVTDIGSSFQSCSSLTHVSIPSGVTIMVNNAFQSCSSLTHVSIPSGVTSIGTNAFYACYSLTSVRIPSGVTSIGYNAFYGCYSLESINIPSTVTKIGYSAFGNCYSLKSITLPNNLTTINDGSSSSTTTGCFQACYSLVSLTIPAGCTSFVKNEFKGCYGMAEYHFKATTVPTLANVNCFSNIQSDCIIYVPSSKLNDYKTAENWATYASYMVGE